jgi:hypothetical protein
MRLASQNLRSPLMAGALVFLAACTAAPAPSPTAPPSPTPGANVPIELTFDFTAGGHQWKADYTDYTKPVHEGIQFHSELEQRGYLLYGRNVSDDLFMYLSRQLTAEDGIVAGQSYRLTYKVTFLSDGPTGCMGIGGAPGEGVVLKLGGSAIEPGDLGNLVDPQVQGVGEAPAGREVGRVGLRGDRRRGMQRVAQQQPRAVPAPAPLDQPAQVGEVADPPAVGRPERVELHQPPPLGRREPQRRAPRRRGDQLRLGVLVAGLDAQAVIALGEIGGKLEGVGQPGAGAERRGRPSARNRRSPRYRR